MDKKSFHAIYSRHADRLYNFIIWTVSNRDVAQDILQKVFIKVWTGKNVPIQESELEPWLFTVAKNSCMDWFRQKNRSSRFRLQYSHETSLPAVENHEENYTWELLHCLDYRERAILYMHIKAGYSYDETARMLGMNSSAVRVRAFRALAKLRKKYAKGTV